MKTDFKSQSWKIILFTGVIALFVLKFDQVIAYLKTVFTAISPILIGIVIAFILNIIMVKIEGVYFSKSDNKWVNKSRRPVSLLLSLFSVLIVIYFIGILVIPQFITSVRMLILSIPELAQSTWDFAVKRGLDPAVLGLNPEMFNQPSSELIQRGVQIGQSFLGGFMNVITSAFGLATNILMGFGFAIFMLSGKEMLLRNINRLLDAYISKNRVRTIRRNSKIINESFKDFFTGQFIEAIVIGVLTTILMMIFRFPYATMIGSVVGLTNIIPIIGPFIGGAVGAILIVLQNPMQALWFILLILFIQQIDGNIIYPRVVGTSIGLPGIWVFAAVIIGAGLFGAFGALLSVPLTAAFYKILKYDVEKKEELVKEGREEKKIRDPERGMIDLK